jgi:hypothetical protein
MRLRTVAWSSTATVAAYITSMPDNAGHPCAAPTVSAILAPRFPSGFGSVSGSSTAPNHVGAAISRHKRAGRIEERDRKLVKRTAETAANSDPFARRWQSGSVLVANRRKPSCRLPKWSQHPQSGVAANRDRQPRSSLRAAARSEHRKPSGLYPVASVLYPIHREGALRGRSLGVPSTSFSLILPGPAGFRNAAADDIGQRYTADWPIGYPIGCSA